MVLRSVGISPLDEMVYRCSLRQPQASVSEIAESAGIDRLTAQACLDRLAGLHLIQLLENPPGGPARAGEATVVASRPDVAIDLLVARQRDRLDDARRVARLLLDEMVVEDRMRPESLVEVVTGPAMVAARFAQVCGQAKVSIKGLDKPPYAVPREQTDPQIHELAEAGVVVRTIYSTESWQDPADHENLPLSASPDEECRAHPAVPMKLIIVDNTVAIMPLTLGEGIDSVLLVHGRALVEALDALFEALWVQSVPLSHLPPEGVDDRLLFNLLASGMKDETIARQLGVSARTIGRRMSEAMARLGARTRFHAGVLAARSGELDTDSLDR